MTENEKDPKAVEIENLEVSELEDEDLEDVSGGFTDTNCGCTINTPAKKPSTA
jgi:hypothetical protein